MTASLEDAEDLVQETLLRAWRRRDGFEGRSSLRAWLYRIATNACLDELRRRPDRVAIGGGVEVPWLQPFPDEMLEQIVTADEEPDSAVIDRETIELAFLVAVQHLPPRQRAVLLMRDVLGWSAAQTAEAIEQSVAGVNSALQRAHATLREHLPERRSNWTAGLASAEDRELLDRYMKAHDLADAGLIADLLGDEMRFTASAHAGRGTASVRALGPQRIRRALPRPVQARPDTSKRPPRSRELRPSPRRRCLPSDVTRRPAHQPRPASRSHDVRAPPLRGIRAAVATVSTHARVRVSFVSGTLAPSLTRRTLTIEALDAPGELDRAVAEGSAVVGGDPTAFRRLLDAVTAPSL